MILQYEHSSVVVPKKTEEKSRKDKGWVGEVTKGKEFLNIGVVSVSVSLILELIYRLAETNRMRCVLSRCQREDQSRKHARLLGHMDNLNGLLTTNL